MIDLAKIKAAALAATQGEWDTDGFSSVGSTRNDQVNGGYFTALCEGPDKLSNATYIAVANPSAVLELITTLEETQADLAQADAILIKVAQLLEGVDYRGDYAEGVRMLVTHQAAHIDALKLMFEMPIINDTYNQVRESHDFAIDDIEYDMFSSGWRNAVSLVIRNLKGMP